MQCVDLETEAMYHNCHNLPTYKITSYSQRALGIRQKHGSIHSLSLHCCIRRHEHSESNMSPLTLTLTTLLHM